MEFLEFEVWMLFVFKLTCTVYMSTAYLEYVLLLKCTIILQVSVWEEGNT